ncbi:MAG: DUF192 domain-containing protein [Xanthobacteraceae bacterium]|nr:DUF192 domain-containing protein [Xanthobacteraceae bacterium]
MVLFRRLVRYVAFALLFLIGLAIVMTAVVSAQDAPQPKLKLESLEILTKSGIRVFQIEFAQTEDQRRIGLMHRQEVPDGEGMLFDFARPQPVAMWMKNTIVSLDMIFIRADGTIANIARNTTPFSQDTIYSEGYVKGVLEVVAGTADKYGIAPGDKVSHRIFGTR